eukprot:COSAG06_NODE_3269_length_5588_cov_7.264711_3_plen_115_part_00
MLHTLMMTLANARIRSTIGSPAGYFFKRANCLYDHLLFADDTASLTVPVEVWRDGQRELLTVPETWPTSLACCAGLPPSAAGHARRAAIAWRALTRLAGLHPLRISPYARAAGS